MATKNSSKTSPASDPEVVVMGETVSTSHRSDRRRHDSHHVVWGFFLIFAGFIFLLNTLGYLPWAVWGHLWRVWPVFIILAGLRIILGNHPISQFLLSLIATALFVFLAAFVINYVSPGLLPLPPAWENLFRGYSQSRFYNSPHQYRYGFDQI